MFLIMKRILDYIFITVITLLLLVVAYASFFVEYKDIYVSFESNDKEVIINPYYDNEDNIMYFFLPSHCLESQSKTRVILNGNNSISLNDNKLLDNIGIEDIKLNIEYFTDFFKHKNSKVIFMTGSNIPSLHIEIPKSSLEYLEQDKSYSVSGNMLLINDDGTIEYSNDFDSFSGRGNVTWETMPKRPWSLKLNKEESLLGMNKSKEWVLFANALDDTTGFRNYAAYKLAKSIGLENTSDMKFIDLYVNGEYLGLYQLCEKIEEPKLNIGNLDELNNIANKSVLKINKLNQTAVQDNNISKYSYSTITSPNDISGGYILERNYGEKLYDKPHYFTTDLNESFVIRYPEVASKDEVIYISNIFQSIENALFSSDYIDQSTNKSLEQLIDIDSWIKKYLVDEITKNEGAGSTSSYYYKKQGDDRIYGGPVWDYDKSFGNFSIWQNSEGLLLSKAHPISPTYWYERLYKYEKTLSLIKQYYLDSHPYLEELSKSLIDQWSNMISDSYLMDSIRWDYMAKDINKNYPEYIYNDNLYDAKEYMKNWITNRLEFLDRTWLND